MHIFYTHIGTPEYPLWVKDLYHVARAFLGNAAELQPLQFQGHVHRPTQVWTNCITPRELELAQPNKQTREPLQNLLQPGHTAKIMTLPDSVNHPINRMGNRLAVFPTLGLYLWTFNYTLRSDGRPGIGMLLDAPS